MSRRIALLIQNRGFSDRRLDGVRTPQVDMYALAESLRDPQIGDFGEVEICRHATSRDIREKAHNLFYGKRRWDLVLLFYAGIIIQDQGGQLYLGGSDTELSDLSGTAVSAVSLTQSMDRSFSRRQVVILDSANVLLTASNRIEAFNRSLDVEGAMRGKGRWRVIMSAANQPDYFIHPGGVHGSMKVRGFTSFLAEGLRTGAADLDGDGQIGVKEFFEYARQRELENGSEAEPKMWSFRRSAWVVIAGNPTRVQEESPPIKWDLIFGAIFAPFVTILFGHTADLVYSLIMAGLFFLLYLALYQILE